MQKLLTAFPLLLLPVLLYTSLAIVAGRPDATHVGPVRRNYL